jgi:hypothetical protein
MSVCSDADFKTLGSSGGKTDPYVEEEDMNKDISRYAEVSYSPLLASEKTADYGCPKG